MENEKHINWIEKTEGSKLDFANQGVLDSFVSDIQTCLRAGQVETALINIVEKRLRWADQADFYAGKGQLDDAIQWRLLAKALENLQSSIERRWNIKVD